VASVLSQLGDDAPLYKTLRQLARARLACCPPGATFSPTELVHEAFIRLAEYEGRGNAVAINNSSHLAALAATTIRRVVIDSLRRRRVRSRALLIITGEAAGQPESLDAELLSETIDLLQRKDPTAASVVELRFFGGLTMLQIAGVLGLTISQVEREWRFARAWIGKQLDRETTAAKRGANPRPNA